MQQELGKYLIVAGSLLLALGLIFLLGGKLNWFGKLPGDILIKKEGFSFYFPVVTCILASVILSVIFSIFSKK